MQKCFKYFIIGVDDGREENIQHVTSLYNRRPIEYKDLGMIL